jgi:2-polyprenyl-6-hydroxyphenyl methylase/3-demethylubiquinone-9 3-methyltransferase
VTGGTTPVDNQLYDRLSETWWSDDGTLSLLRTGLNPARFPWLRQTLTETLGRDPQGLRILDVGCGGGLLAEEFARIGCRVTGVDPSSGSLDVARAHAAVAGLEIDYRLASGERLPFDDGAFAAVYCCDVLEHVDDVGATIREIARVLQPGGVFLYDTINRTLRSRLVMIKLLQEWDATRCMEPNLHDWLMFIKPTELRAQLERAGLRPSDDVVGIAPGAKPPALVKALRAHRKGTIDSTELGRRLAMHESRDRSILYAGYALKP